MSINKDSQKAPNLRFKGFTDDWEQRKLDTIGNTFTGLSGKTKEDFGHGEAKYIPYTNIFNNPITNVDQLESIEIDKKQNSVAYGDILFTTSSETPEEVGMSSVWMYEKENVYLNSFCFGFRPIEKHYPLYLAYLLRSPDMRKKFMLLAQGISRYNISKNKVLELAVPLPVISEQIKIGNTLKNLYDTITLLQRKLDQLNQLKEALLQQMFPGKGETVPKLRFAGFEGDWEERKLGDLLHERNQKSIQTEEYPLVSFTVENGVTEKTERYNRNQLVSGDSDAKVYKVTKLNDIVYNPANLKFGAIDRNKYGNAVFSPIYVTFEVIEDYIFAEFIEFIVTSQTFIGRALKYQQGTVYERQSVGVDDFLNLTIRIPNLDEQKLIGLFLNDLNKKLLLQKDKLDQLKHMKQVLLQNMFI